MNVYKYNPDKQPGHMNEQQSEMRQIKVEGINKNGVLTAAGCHESLVSTRWGGGATNLQGAGGDRSCDTSCVLLKWTAETYLVNVVL